MSGPWENYLKQAAGMASSDEERQALEDGVIEESEYAYFKSEIIVCLENLGIEAYFKADKSLSYVNAKKWHRMK